ncbi:MAG: type pilus assembly protein PilA, partial [Thermoanaerobacter sp.]|nr:type pilus assembly protein PilA [Thermoanaerobacter sp.]
KALNKDERGFTLIELIVVIAILGVLAAIAVPQFTGTLNQSKIKADEASAQIIADAAARWIMDRGSDTPSPTLKDLITDKYINGTIDSQGNVTKPTVQSNPNSTFNITTSNGIVTVTVSGTNISKTAPYEIIK